MENQVAKTRSRTGCSRCKRKRLKCDETKPGCLQCQKRRVSCPGYEQGVRWSAKHEVFRESIGRNQRRRSKSVTDDSPHRRSSPVPEPRIRAGDVVSTATLDGENVNVDGSTEEDTLGPEGCGSSPFAISPAGAQSGSVPTAALRNVDSGTILPHLGPDPLPELQSLPSTHLPRRSSLQSILVTTPVQEAVFPSNPSPFLDPETERSALMNFYFGTLCRLNSAFDSATNPFRYIVSEWMVDSPLIQNCVLSTSAKALVQRHQQVLPKVVQYHSAAVVHLSDILSTISRRDSVEETSRLQLSTFDSTNQVKRAVLASIFLGISSTWLDTSDLGVQHLRGARRLLAEWQSMACKDDDQSESDEWAPSTAMNDPEKSFLIGTLAYWESLLAFVVDQPLSSIDYLKPFCDQSSLDTIHLNPWTGICTPLFVYLTQVAILVRQKRLYSRMELMGWSSSVEAVRSELLTSAFDIERRILSYKLPPRSRICDTGDPLVSVTHLESFAHCYQLASLLELYRSFPELLDKQVSVHSPEGYADSPSILTHHHQNVLAGRLLQEHGRAPRMLLFSMTTTVIGLLQGIPERCGISLNHTMAMIISGGVLGYKSEHASGRTADPGVSSLMSSISLSRTSVDNWRATLRSRTKSNARATCLNSFGLVPELLQQVWSRMDAMSDQESIGSNDALDVHWMDVMAECRLETVYG